MTKKTSYWEQRAAAERKWQEEQLQIDGRFAKELDRGYQIAIDEINKEIRAKIDSIGGVQNLVTASQMQEYERLAQRAVQHANELRAQHHHVSYSDFSSEVNQRLRVYNATMQINQLEWIKSQVGTHLVNLGMDTQTKIGDKLYNDYLKEMKRQAGILGISAKAHSTKQNSFMLDQVAKQINSAQFSKHVWANVDLLKARLDGILATGLVRGDNPREMARYITKQVGDTLRTGAYAADRIARTESARVQHLAQLDSLKDNDFKYCKWYAEPNACSACREIVNSSSSKKYPEGVYRTDDVPAIPVHPNCRCSIGAYWMDED